METAEAMRTAVLERLDGQDLFIAAAAVADYRPREVAGQKVKKDAPALTLELIRNPDILAEVAARHPRPFVVGFAAETSDLRGNALAKLARKGLDLIAANDVSAGRGIGRPTNALSVFWQGGERLLPEQPKADLARALVDLITERMKHGSADPSTT